MAAATRLIAERGVQGATIRAIAEAAGVTEGAVYRHYQTKAELCLEIYQHIVQDMAIKKEHLITSRADFCEKLREWVRLSYEYFDHYPASFTYVLLTQHKLEVGLETVASHQGKLFEEMLRRAQDDGQVRDLAPELALSHFTGVMLNVPRLINQGRLPGPATQYVDEVADAVWHMLKSRRETQRAKPQRRAGGAGHAAVA